MIRGIDVSSYQSTFDTDGLSFVIIKATEGRSYINPRLTAQTKLARDGGCVVGFYHFLWPGNITAQAEYFVSKAPEKAGDLLAVDWEWTGDHTAASNAEKDRFIREVKRLRPSHRVALYTNRDFWLNRDSTSCNKRRPLDRRLRDGGQAAHQGEVDDPSVHVDAAGQERGGFRERAGAAGLGEALVHGPQARHSAVRSGDASDRALVTASTSAARP